MDELSFDGRVAIVTGAGNGIGRLHALELARRGARVVVNDLGGAKDGTGSSASVAESVVAEITGAGGEAIASTDSVSTPEGGADIVQRAIDAWGQVDIVVNNAGILRDAAFKNTTSDLLDPVLDVHLRGAFNVTRPAWLHMLDRGYGRIVNTASGSGLFGNFGQSNYGAAKMGLIGLTRVQAIEGLCAAAAGVAFRVSHDDPELVVREVEWFARAVEAEAGRLAAGGLPLRAKWFRDALARRFEASMARSWRL
jgi:NAD(P)-dependent dehydrogenase (short-subunit alcohol dehydrogenase family)